MSTEVKQAATIKGGESLIKESSPFETFTPENFTEEQLMIRDMCDQFICDAWIDIGVDGKKSFCMDANSFRP